MNTIYPNNLDIKFYEKTIQENPNVILDGFYYGPFNKAYKQSRLELINSFKLIYTCDYWLDGYCWQDDYSFYQVLDITVLRLIEKYYRVIIPMGCLAIAVKHRDEVHYMSPNYNGFYLIFKKKAFFDYLELNK